MRITKHLRRRAVIWATAGLAVTAVASVLSLTTASAAPVTSARTSGPFTFRLVPSPNIKSCLPHAGGLVTIVPGSQNDTMHGIQVLNTSEFPDAAGPLAHVHR